MKKKSLELSIVIPVFNEQGNMGSLIGEIQKSLPSSIAYEIIVVDDASTDGTVAELQEYSTIRLLRHGRNYGQSTAIRTGVMAARHPLIVTLDGDGQNDPKDIITLLNHYQEGAVVFGERQQRRDNFLKRLSSRLANSLRQRILKDHSKDTGCALKLFPKEGYLRLPLFKHSHRFLPALFSHYGYHLIAVPVGHRPRYKGTSKYGFHNRFWTSLVDILGVYWLLKRPCFADEVEQI